MTNVVNLRQYGDVHGASDVRGKHNPCLDTFSLWHDCVEAKKIEALMKNVSKDVALSPPTYNHTYKGRGPFSIILSTVGEVFTNFSYHRQWLSDDASQWCLEFTATIADTGLQIKGCDLVSLGSNGKIEKFEVVARPPSAVSALLKEMGDRVPAKMQAMQEAKSARAKM